MTSKRLIFNCALLASFLLCYTEWGNGRHAFLFQIINDIFHKDHWIRSMTNPLILAGLGGILLLVIAPWITTYQTFLTRAGIVLLGIIVLIYSLVGVLSFNIKILGSVIPFIVLAVYGFRRL